MNDAVKTDIMEMQAIVHGMVQGVGFRAAVRHHALKIKLNGTVSNLFDGSVEIYAQGPRRSLDQLVTLLKQNALPGRVDSIQTNYYPPSKLYSSFAIV